MACPEKIIMKTQNHKTTKYMSCGPYLLHNATDGVFQPRSPVP